MIGSWASRLGAVRRGLTHARASGRTCGQRARELPQVGNLKPIGARASAEGRPAGKLPRDLSACSRKGTRRAGQLSGAHTSARSDRVQMNTERRRAIFGSERLSSDGN